MTAIVKRPVKGPVLVRLDYRKPPANQEWLSSRFRLDGYDGQGFWRVQRARTDDLLRDIIRDFGRVEFWVESRKNQSRCDIQCVGAKGWDCECSCGGLNHRGTTDGWHQVGSTTLVKASDGEWTRRVLSIPPIETSESLVTCSMCGFGVWQYRVSGGECVCLDCTDPITEITDHLRRTTA